MTQVRLLIGIAGLLALIGAFFYGRSVGVDHQRAIQAKSVARAVEIMTRARDAMDNVSGYVAVAQVAQGQETRTIYETATQYVAGRTVYRNQCIDADGGILLDRAVANANREPAGTPAGDAAAGAEGAAQR